MRKPWPMTDAQFYDLIDDMVEEWHIGDIHVGLEEHMRYNLKWTHEEYELWAREGVVP